MVENLRGGCWKEGWASGCWSLGIALCGFVVELGICRKRTLKGAGGRAIMLARAMWNRRCVGGMPRARYKQISKRFLISQLFES